MSSRMRARAGRARSQLLAAVVLVTAPLLHGATAQAAEPAPSISVASPRVAVDQATEVVGTGFPAGQDVPVEVCGVPDAAGRLTCTPAGEVSVGQDGRFVHQVTVVEPAGECPCVVKVAAPGLPPATATLQIASVPVATQAKAPQLVVDGAEIEGARGLRALFTGSASAELVLTLRNAGVSPAQPTLQLDATDGGDAATAVPDPGLPEVAAGEDVTVRVPVEVGGLLGGRTTVDGYVVVGDSYAPVWASTRVVPWGLILVVVGLVVVVVRRFVGKDRREEAPARRVRTPGARRAADSGDHTTAARPLVPGPSSDPSSAQSPVAPAAAVPMAAAVAAVPMAAATEAEPDAPARQRGGLFGVGGAARAAAAAAIEQARAAEAEEAAFQSSVIRDESVFADTEARLDALARHELSRPEPAPAAQPVAQVPEVSVPAENRRRGRRGDAPADALVGPPRLAETPIDRSRLGELAPETPEVDDAVTAYLRATAPQVLEERPARPTVGDPLNDPLTGPLPVAMPAPLDLPLPVPTLAPTPLPVQGSISAADAAFAEAQTLAVPVVTATGEAGTSMADALRARAEQRDAAIVGAALQAVRTHTAETPARLPDPHEYVPAQRDRRAPKGGKRAARPEKGESRRR